MNETAFLWIFSQVYLYAENTKKVSYFADLSRHRIQFRYESLACDEAIEMVGTSKTKLRMDERFIISHMSYLDMVIFLSLSFFIFIFDFL